VKRATLLIVGLMVLAAALASATVRPAQEPKRGSEPAAQAAPAAPPAADAAGHPGAEGPAAGEHQPGGEKAAHAANAEAAGEAGHKAEGESPWATAARLFNFALLAGILVYLLRSPFGAFLDGRKAQIRKSLTDAAAMRDESARQLAAIDEKLRALPAELEALQQRGAAEISAEEARIRQAADVERERMLENARREIDRRGHLAERRLVQRAGDLAVAVATERVKRTITDADQLRLVDRYLRQVRPEATGS
jgi:F-type H+-transporting ATPase subunit b